MKKEQTPRPDIYIGLVGAAGSDLESVKLQLRAQLAALDYAYEEIKLSRIIGEFCRVETSGTSEDKRIEALMNAGDQIRRERGQGDGVICLAAAEIRRIRKGTKNETPETLGATGFIIDSLKNPDEVRTLRRVYGRNFLLISVYCPKTDRISKLAKRISASQNTTTRQEHFKAAKHVIEEDERRDATDLSQDVQATFPLADLFVSHEESTEVQIKRFIELAFGEPFSTPTLAEYLMFVAKASALRSCDLSRQVGAVIAEKSGAIISSGCNDVPYPGGGIFFEGREGAKDNRDHTVEYDPNASEIQNTIREVVKAFRQAKLLDLETASRTDDELAAALVHGEWKPHLGDARVRNLIEFGRVVHAEMNALAEAARFGRATQDATLYCTTFPCHICARHIIAAGISKVVFIEPYPKSMTQTLYGGEIRTDDSPGTLPTTVEFKPFTGVAPRLYQRVFEYRPRKNRAGNIVHWNRNAAIPIDGV
ncbi:anti-phage dCTP deaminase, partial [Sphingobium sp. AN641]|uniref:anti-phage dCTP deaminase n=1 Tax=Sphingobium sp. AN641 TaxID=3133443 RepID=UPI0030C1EA9D